MRDELLMWLPESRMLLARFEASCGKGCGAGFGGTTCELRPDVTLSDEALLTMVHETQLEALASYPG
eukprot:5926749-Amphidinium_carterae.1